jgi:hypothetical protein
MTLKDILYTPVEPLNHAVGLRRLWWCQTVVDAEFVAKRSKLMFSVAARLRRSKVSINAAANQAAFCSSMIA